MSDESKAIKVAILGGGMAAMSAAFELTDPSLHGKYEVTLYRRRRIIGVNAISVPAPAKPSLHALAFILSFKSFGSIITIWVR
jgi:predicted NAD/FAD-binding protein